MGDDLQGEAGGGTDVGIVLRQSLQGGNGVVFVIGTVKHVGHGCFGQVGILQGGFVDGLRALFQQFGIFQAALGELQEGAFALGFACAGQYAVQIGEHGGRVADGEGAHPRHALLGRTGNRLHFSPFLIDGFGDGIGFGIYGDFHGAFGHIGIFGVAKGADIQGKRGTGITVAQRHFRRHQRKHALCALADLAAAGVFGGKVGGGEFVARGGAVDFRAAAVCFGGRDIQAA